VLAPSEATRQTLIRGRIDPSKIGIWRRGVSTERFTPAKRSAELRRGWGVTDGQLALLYVGRVSKEKGLDLLAPLSERLRRLRIAHRLIVVGDGPMRRDLMDRCEGASFLGTLSPEGVAAAMASSDVFVFPSRTDTAGNVVLEAQASGLPVLVTDEGGPCENITDTVTGFVCPDLRAFTRRIGELAWNPERLAPMRRAARLYALDRQCQLLSNRSSAPIAKPPPALPRLVRWSVDASRAGPRDRERVGSAAGRGQLHCQRAEHRLPLQLCSG
jgi:glycosyltransferase involved in cell wall biosynthesis